MLKKSKHLIVMTLIFSIILAIASFASTSEILIGPASNDAAFKVAGPDIANAVEYGQKITIKDKEIVKITIDSMPTWGPRDASEEDNSAKISVFKWDTDYATTVAGTAIKTVEINNHADGAKVEIAFDKAQPAGTYLWVITEAEAAVGGIGFWGGSFTSEDLTCFVNGVENNNFVARVKVTVQENTATSDTVVFFAFVVMVALATAVARKRVFN